MKNAIENVNCSLNELNEAKASLEQALSTVEKPENKKLIQDSLNSVCESIECVQNTVKNYKESSK
ncbi:hypothetical protein [Clostridium thermobutyricum]|jgi:hypothetical protein|uniref:Uncharacterized protein n=1 Tax=Clostridium thermobutyricum TaxID=29372 RepID=N9WC57_9CLOT|nr:hypothetical protein [Clostridium thermobutyricum]ENZ00460.1 hypothetical protein HMPREF1092_02627 [Clostridium thermobutyricum]